MKHYRFKNEKEMIKTNGKDWRKTLGVGFEFDDMLGKDLPERDCVLLNGNVGDPLLVEVNPVAYDVKKVFIDKEKGKVTVILRNGNEGRSSCSPDDTFDPYVGFALAYVRAQMGSATQYRKYLDIKLERLERKEAKKK